MNLRVRDEEFQATVRARAWEPAERLDAVDATVEIEAISASLGARVLGLIHGHLTRTNGRFVVPVSLGQIGEVVGHAFEEWARDDGLEREGERSIRVCDARWRMTAGAAKGTSSCAIPETSVPVYSGRAYEVVEARLALGSAEWMQDWPLEVSDPSRLAEFCACYDELTEPGVRFDVMRLVLFSCEHAAERPSWEPWLERTLRRDFALHGHTVAYWAALDREADDAELSSAEPENVFPISGLLRRIWEESLVPVAIEWTGAAAGP